MASTLFRQNRFFRRGVKTQINRIGQYNKKYSLQLSFNVQTDIACRRMSTSRPKIQIKYNTNQKKTKCERPSVEAATNTITDLLKFAFVRNSHFKHAYLFIH